MKTAECLPALRALADPTRLKIVELLLATDRNVNELAEKIGTPQYNISKHLRTLREARIVQTTKHGQETRCEVMPEFRTKLREGGWAVDLGCCSFRFDKGGKC
jgi:DNA-binding transcriptional ArsR family regulator